MIIVASGEISVCFVAHCTTLQGALCVNFRTQIDAQTGKEEVDENSVSMEYSSPQFRALIDEAAYKAEFIAEVNANL